VYTIIETPTFARQWPDYWTEDERGEFVAWLALHPEIGDVILRGRAVAGRFAGRALVAESEAEYGLFITTG
jgi:hypothetical protein